MIVEVAAARGLRLWIDGHKPEPTQASWIVGDYGDEPEGAGFSAGMRISNADGTSLKVGPHLVTGLRSDIDFSDVYAGHVPTQLVLELEGKEPVTLRVVDYDWGDPDDGEPVQVVLSNGETIEVDEITLYLRAEN